MASLIKSSFQYLSFASLRGSTTPFPATLPLLLVLFYIYGPIYYINVALCLVFFLTPPTLPLLADEGSLDEDAGPENALEVGSEGEEVGE